MRDEPRPKSHDSRGGTLGAFQRRGEVIKPAELIEVRGGEKITLAARRIYNQLLSNAFGPDMAAEGQEYRIPFAELRGNHTSNDRVTEAILSLMQTVVRVRMSDGSTRNVHLLGPTDVEKFGPGIATMLTYELHPKLLPILRDSQIFARLEMQILHGFGTKYGMALYEMIAKRAAQKHLGAYFDKGHPILERVAILRARLDMSNSDLIEHALNELWARHEAERRFEQ